SPRRRQPNLALTQATLPIDGHTVLEHDHRRCLILEARLQLLGDLALCPIIRAFLLPLGACLGLLLSRPRRRQFAHLDLCPAVWRLKLDDAVGAGCRTRVSIVLLGRRKPRVNTPELSWLADAHLNQAQARVSNPPVFHGGSPFVSRLAAPSPSSP